MAIPIQELNLPARSVNSLKGEGIDTVGQLVSRTEIELLSIRNLGRKSVSEIEQRLGDLGLSLAGQAEAGQAEAGRAERPGAEQEAVTPAVSAMAASASAAGAVADSAAANGATADRATADSAAWDGARPAAWTGDEDAALRPDEPEDDALNLFDVAAWPILKRALPVAAATVLLIWVGTRIRVRGRARRASSL